jgi:hydrogenase expression/formation protein HypE
MPLRDQQRVMLGHGGGGKLSSELIEHLFLPAFDAVGAAQRDSAILETGGIRLAFTTDSYVVQPLFFPGGSIGDLAINGTVNDLAMSGAIPLGLSCGFILEEGLELDVLGQIAEAMGRAAKRANVRLVTGDTKVVEHGAADGVYINTSGVGLIPVGVDLRPDAARTGDQIIVSGPIGEHGVAIMSVREGISFGTEVRTDSAPLSDLVAAMLAACPGGTGAGIHVLRDPTRGGVAASLCEIAESSDVGVEFRESSLPIPAAVAAACGFLGLDPLHVANEGKLVAFVTESVVEAVLRAMRAHEFGREATVIGHVTDVHPGMVVGRTALGGTRIVDRPLGEQLPRIC